MDPSLMVSCKQVLCAEDAVQAVQRRRTHARRCYRPASDAEFLRSIADKTPGRDDDEEEAMRRRRQVYLKSYAFSTKWEAAEADGKTAGRGGGRALVDAVLPPTLLRRRKTTHNDATCSSNKTTASSSFTSTSNPSMWCPRNAGKVLSRAPGCSLALFPAHATLVLLLRLPSRTTIFVPIVLLSSFRQASNNQTN
ncbi:unnamed protein product [Miscanthus lutarioriparius]|uniref:Uncharacterized protein n=1 Tax=Miscanthus lutarioriparius TaxID=422564 RepID=A0A811QRV6_9POAL|nr:unnamed protein product [Miscanthus lutarioriparius]